MSSFPLFIPLRFGGDLAFDLIRARIHLLGSGAYYPTRASRLPGNVCVFLVEDEAMLAGTQAGELDGVRHDLTDPLQFARFMSAVDKIIRTAVPDFPTSGLYLADTIAHYMHTVNRALPVDSFPYDGLFADKLELPDLRGAWTLSEDVRKFIDDACKGSEKRPDHFEAFIAGEEAFCYPRDNHELAIELRWYSQVESWQATREGAVPDRWTIQGLFWVRMQTAPGAIAAMRAILDNAATQVREGGPDDAAISAAIDELALAPFLQNPQSKVELFSLQVGTEPQLFAAVDLTDGRVSVWANKQWAKVNGMWDKDLVTAVAYLKDKILADRAKPNYPIPHW